MQTRLRLRARGPIITFPKPLFKGKKKRGAVLDNSIVASERRSSGSLFSELELLIGVRETHSTREIWRKIVFRLGDKSRRRSEMSFFQMDIIRVRGIGNSDC